LERPARRVRDAAVRRRARWRRTAAALTQGGQPVSVAGGGDTVAALNQAGVADDFTSSRRQAAPSLEWMEGKELPGVKRSPPEILNLQSGVPVRGAAGETPG
jgi:hypothetical protein